METLNPRAGFLSNYEVLAHLKAQSADRQQTLRQLAEDKRQRCARLGRRPYAKEKEDDEGERVQPQDLHTVTFETIKYLEDPVHPIRRQTASSITTLLDGLEKLDLTKAERLQIVNLAPTNLVSLVVCVEDFEERFPDSSTHDSLLSLVRSHLSSLPAPATIVNNRLSATPMIRPVELQEEEKMEEDERVYEGAHEEDEELVQEGLQGEGEDMGRELDEGDA